MPPSATAPCLARGTSWGRYTVLDRVGEGSMGVVYAAYDPRLDRRVALKVLQRSGEGAPTPEERQRFLLEAQAMARLSHPNVLTVYDTGEIEGEAFITMEFVDGTTLRQWLREHAGNWRDVLAVFEQAGRGLEAAHRSGIVHRDFKPENVLVDSEGRVHVTDFGLAGTVAARPDPSARPDAQATVTQTSAFIGTPAYAAPEQLNGEPIDHRTDQFAFCVALYEALYGERPFSGASVNELVFAITMGRINPAPKRTPPVPPEVRAVVLRGLSTIPNDRFPSMQALMGALAPAPRLSIKVRIALALAATAGAVALATAWLLTRPAPSRAGSEALTHLATAEASSPEAMHLTAEGKDDELAAMAWVLLLEDIGDQKGRRANYDLPMPAADAAVMGARSDPERARLLELMAVVDIARGRVEYAQQEAESALALRERTFGPDHVRVANALVILADAFTEALRPEHARTTLERAASIFEHNQGPHDPDFAAALLRLGILAQQRGEHREAIGYLERALAIVDKGEGPSHPHVAAILTDLGVSYEELGQHRRAQECFERALTSHRRAHGEEHYLTGSCFDSSSESLLLESRFR